LGKIYSTRNGNCVGQCQIDETGGYFYGARPGWLLVRDTSEDGTPDGVAEFRAQYSVPPNTKLDFSTSGKATFFVDVIDGLLISEEDVKDVKDVICN